MMFSIIVPVYNSEASLASCVRSVLEQSFQDWELILVNDGSTDTTPALIDGFVREDKRIRAIHKHNEGQLFSRQKGMALAEGEYFLFLDSDDYWHPDCLAVLDAAIKDKSPDVVMFPAKRIGATRGDKDLICNISEQPQWIGKTSFYSALISGVNFNSMCLKAWKRSLFDGDNTDYSCFSDICWGEDRVQLLYPITKAEKILFIPQVLYFYVDNPSSVTHGVRPEAIDKMLSNDAFRMLYCYMKQWNMDLPEHKEAIAVQYIRNYINVYYNVRRCCTTRLEKKQLRKYIRNAEVSTKAFRYMFSRKLTLREKIKLILARYIKI